MPKNSTKKSFSTEIRIKEAAHKVFLAKGFAAATVRDVAKEAGSNVALVNYYYRSKKKLFDVVMQEKIQFLLGTLFPILNDAATTLDEKVELIVGSYIDFLTKNPDLPTFILNELRKSNFDLLPRERFDPMVIQSPFMKQLKQESGDVNPLHFFISLLGMTVFPFVARPILFNTGLINEQTFPKMMTERKKLIPEWIKAMRTMNAKQHRV